MTGILKKPEELNKKREDRQVKQTTKPTEIKGLHWRCD